MNLKFFYMKQLYQLKQKINHLTERDRALLLFIIVTVLVFFWFFTVFKFEVDSTHETKQQSQKIQEQVASLLQKKKIIQILISSPDTEKIISHYKDLTSQITKLDKEFTHYNERYITERELATLLHDMLKQTMGVTIENFGTVIVPVIIQSDQKRNLSQQTDPNQVTAPPPTLQTTHYRLVIRGTYFPIMRYLQRLEQLPWQLYWDKFNYTVLKYPEGIATVDFYTLKQKSVQQIIKQGSNQ